MDVLDKDLLNFWNSLNTNHVEYIMVGGISVNMHGYLRNTNDIDMWIDDTKQNRINLSNALVQFGYDDINLIDFEFLPGWSSFFISQGIELDILIKMKGLENYTFKQCLSMALKAEIENIIVPFLHINHLIENKKAVNRSKDKIDVEELEKIILQKPQ
jgi:hypothetical protein